MTFELRLQLISDATFGRGDGVAGLVDTEVEHDEYGLPFLRGRTLKGLLVEECANILWALQQAQPGALGRFTRAARDLFGRAGSTLDDDTRMRVSDASLPLALRAAVAKEIEEARQPDRGLQPEDVLASLTAIRRQTAVQEETEAPERNSLRSLRVVLRGVEFVATLDCDSRVMSDDARALLAACALALRRAGTGRNRGRGKLQARLYEPTISRREQDKDVTDDWFALFADCVETKGRGQ